MSNMSKIIDCIPLLRPDSERVVVSKLPTMDNESLTDNDYFYVVDTSNGCSRSSSKKISFGSLRSKILGGLSDKNLEKTSIEVMVGPNIPVGYCKELNSNIFKEVPSGNIMSIGIRVDDNELRSDSDVVIDWGDHTVTILREYDTTIKDDYYPVDHAYSDPGKYIINIYGRKYHGLTCSNTDNNLICNLLNYELPIASNCWDLSGLCNNALRLVDVNIPCGFKLPSSSMGLKELFKDCNNLIKVVIGPKLSSVYSLSNIFSGCDNLVSIEWNCPISMNNDYQGMYRGCRLLTTPVIDLLPSGFPQRNVDFSYVFYGCEGLTDYKLFSIDGAHGLLWNDKSKIWYSNNWNFSFTGCSNSLVTNIPESFGGLAVNKFSNRDKDNEVHIKSVAYNSFIIRNDAFNYDDGKFVPTVMKRKLFFDNWDELDPKFTLLVDTSFKRINDWEVATTEVNDNNIVELELPDNCVFIGNKNLLYSRTLVIRSSSLFLVKKVDNKIFICQLSESVNANGVINNDVVLSPELFY